METILHLLFAFLALGVLIFVHELGHYLVALKVGMNVEIFSIGFGKPLLSWMRGSVRWQIGWIPFGGYVKITGMDFSEEEQAKTEGGFFTKSPLKRLWVILAGPMANMILALFIFCLIWVSGGREKLFSEFSNYIGWVDPTSKLYEEGIRPGDKLLSYDNTPYKSSKEFLYATLFSTQKIGLDIEKIDPLTLATSSFTSQVATYQISGAQEGMKTLGIAEFGKYLTYNKLKNGQDNSIMKSSALFGTNLQYGDRIVWADGTFIYSNAQLSAIINDSKTLLTVERDGKNIFVRVSKSPLSELKLTLDVKGELSDWQFLQKMKGRLTQFYFIPYNITSDLIVESTLPYVDPEFKKSQLNAPLLTPFDGVLEKGDKIIAIDLAPINHASELLKALQSKKVNIVVERGVNNQLPISFEEAAKQFANHDLLSEVNRFTATFLNPNFKETQGRLVKLNSVEPKPIMNAFESEDERLAFDHQISEAKKKIESISDSKKRSADMEELEKVLKLKVLGIQLEDQTITYNPNPFELFAGVMSEIWNTLMALFKGSLNPKWLSGPVGILQAMQHGLSIGFNEALFWVAAISINLGFLNLLPIPVLDGGYIVLCLIEIITGKRIKGKTMEKIIMPFMIFLIGFFLFVTYWDILRLF